MPQRSLLRSFCALCLLLCGLAGCTSTGGSSDSPHAPLWENWKVGLEVQAYPAGVITGVQARTPVSDDSEVTYRLAYNATDRQDFGEHDDESGGGPGLGVGYRHYFGPDHSGWLVGGRLDLWILEIDWEDDPPATPLEGTTDVVVLQPTLEGGYSLPLNDDWRFDVTLAVGAEINVDEDGDDVGEGAIGLLGFSFVREF